jgi:hypothetical protein
MSAESYIVRIYRRDPRKRTKVAGVVEIVAEPPITHGFRSVEELQAILLQPSVAPSDAGEKKNRRRTDGE